MTRGFMLAMLATGMAVSSFAALPEHVAQAQQKAIAHLRADVPDVLFFKEGDKLSRVWGVKFAFGSSPRGSADQFIAEYAGMFAEDEGTFQFERTQDVMNGLFTAVYFKEVASGRVLEGAGLTILVKNEAGFPIVLAASRSEVANLIPTTASFTSGQAIQAAKRNVSGLTTFSDPELVAFQTELGTNLTWKFTGDNKNLSSPKRFTFFVDATSGAILGKRNEIVNVDVPGTIKGNATSGLLPDQANNPPTLQNLAGARATVTGGNSAFANATGAFLIPNAGATNVTVTASLTSPFVNVVNDNGTTLSLSSTGAPVGPFDFVFNSAPSEQTTSQVNGFIQTNIVHNFVKAYVPSYPGVDIAIPCHVNVTGTCNAFYTGSTINFYRAGGGCPNTCYTTVLYHEYGHFIIEMAGTGQGAYGEGMGDVNASLLGDTPSLGVDFRGQGTGPLRSCYNSIVYPSSAEIHTAGQIMSGAFWLTTDALTASSNHANALEVIRPLFLNSILVRPAGISPQITIDVLTLDDTNGNIYDGTPHYNEIAQGFNAKNLTAPQLQFLNIVETRGPRPFSLWTPDDNYIPVNVQVFDLTGTLDEQSIELHHRINGGGWNVSSMSVIADPGIAIGGFDQPGCGDVVDYYVTARDTNGHVVTGPTRSTVFGTSQTVLLDDSFQSDLGWTVTNTALTSGAWERGDPNGSNLNGTPANPENDSNDAGSFCMFTGQAAVGAAVGTNDVDGGPTAVTSAVFDLSGGNGTVDYRRWFFNDDGDDSLTVEISNNNGSSWVQVEGVLSGPSTNSWVPRSFLVSQYVTPTANMRLRFSTSDNPNNSITEAAIDKVVIRKVNCN